MSAIQARIAFKHFFDRPAVVDAVGKMKVKALKKSGYAVMQATRRRIKKQGMAKPELKIQKENPGMTLAQLVRSSSIRERDRKAAIRRLREVEDPKHSSPGQSPFTHSGMFRDHIAFHWDPTSESVVIGQEMPRGDWLARLHEFGGSQQVKGYVWVPKYPGPYRSPIMKFRRAGTKVDTSKWQATAMAETRSYPPRPYMKPALDAKIADGTIVNSFKIGGM